MLNRDLARNEEFFQNSQLLMFYSSQKQNTVICGGFCGDKFKINHACLLTCKQTRKIYEHSHRCANTLHPAKNKDLQTEEY